MTTRAERRRKKEAARSRAWARAYRRRLRGMHDRCTFRALHGVWRDTPEGCHVAFVLALMRTCRQLERAFRDPLFPRMTYGSDPAASSGACTTAHPSTGS